MGTYPAVIGPLAQQLGLTDPVEMNWGPNWWWRLLLRSYLTSATTSRSG